MNCFDPTNLATIRLPRPKLTEGDPPVGSGRKRWAAITCSAQRIEGHFASFVIAANDQQVLARCRIVAGWMIGRSAIADVHSVHDC
jgi:hypothetical protein